MTNGVWKLEALSSLLCVATGIFVGLALANATSFGIWLNQWQTLVAGALAVGAAAVTVFQMERTDIRQQARHIELVRLGVRADRLTMLRLRDVWLGNLVAQADAMSLGLATIKEAREAVGNYSPVGLKRAMNMVFDDIVWRFKEILTDPLLVEAKPFFDGRATSAAILVEQSVQATQDTGGPLITFLGFGQAGASFFANAGEWVNRYWDVFEGTPQAIHRFAAEIRRIAALYE